MARITSVLPPDNSDAMFLLFTSNLLSLSTHLIFLTNENKLFKFQSNRKRREQPRLIREYYCEGSDYIQLLGCRHTFPNSLLRVGAKDTSCAAARVVYIYVPMIFFFFVPLPVQNFRFYCFFANYF